MSVLNPSDPTPVGDYAVLGDLGDGTLIVRMWIGGQAFDEEIDVSTVTPGPDEIIQKRMRDLQATPDATLLVDAAQPETIQQAVDLS